ncbi:hypothetical protein CJ030_MR7G001546 [Morella rubra]|uniref:Sugar phosphate/phosphate translocator n=1 Tax=Morella rubra TaxID=262757 RepID=A0A6A1V619_9ROSI|nr:hypothetical protein CJ030_MR7G001546 [Morella rubra]
MVENGLDTENSGYTGVNNAQSGPQGSGLRWEPSLSCWCDDDGRVQFDCQLGNTDECIEEDSDFELPLLQQDEPGNGFLYREDDHDFKERTMHLNSNDTMGEVSTRVGRKENKKYVPFDIENGSVGHTNGLDVSMSMRNREAMTPHSEDPTSVANVLKTLFFILVWYTSSLFLTILLGEDLGSFLAPLLMDTVHCTLRAVLSRAITWFWSHRFQPSVAMPWRDYFVRGGSTNAAVPLVIPPWVTMQNDNSYHENDHFLCNVVPTALGTAMDVNLSNASLVFIMVTFVTMCKSASTIFLLLFAFNFRWTLPFTVVTTALGTAMDINLSNASLVFISVTFATMVGDLLEYYDFMGYLCS